MFFVDLLIRIRDIIKKLANMTTADFDSIKNLF